MIIAGATALSAEVPDELRTSSRHDRPSVQRRTLRKEPASDRPDIILGRK